MGGSFDVFDALMHLLKCSMDLLAQARGNQVQMKQLLEPFSLELQILQF